MEAFVNVLAILKRLALATVGSVLMRLGGICFWGTAGEIRENSKIITIASHAREIGIFSALSEDFI